VSYTLVLHHEAFAELNEAERFLELRVAGLGLRFRNEVDACLRYIQSKPLSYAERRGGYRHGIVAKFTYRVIYKVNGNEIFVAAVYHGKRRPYGWAARRP
jgi:hypothetical protein